MHANSTARENSASERSLEHPGPARTEATAFRKTHKRTRTVAQTLPASTRQGGPSPNSSHRQVSRKWRARTLTPSGLSKTNRGSCRQILIRNRRSRPPAASALLAPLWVMLACAAEACAARTTAPPIALPASAASLPPTRTVAAHVTSPARVPASAAGLPPTRTAVTPATSPARAPASAGETRTSPRMDAILGRALRTYARACGIPGSPPRLRARRWSRPPPCTGTILRCVLASSGRTPARAGSPGSSSTVCLPVGVGLPPAQARSSGSRVLRTHPRAGAIPGLVLDRVSTSGSRASPCAGTILGRVLAGATPGIVLDGVFRGRSRTSPARARSPAASSMTSAACSAAEAGRPPPCGHDPRPRPQRCA